MVTPFDVCFFDFGGSYIRSFAQPVRPARRLRQALAAAAGQHEGDRRIDVDQITGRDVHKFITLAGAQDHADALLRVVFTE